MVVIQKGTGTVDLVFTLTEKATLSQPGYSFVFTNITTKQTVTVAFDCGDDLSEYPDRYNEFTFDRADFSGVPAGQYQYVVTEVGSGVILEKGKMELQPETGLVKQGYTQGGTTITGYGG